jgi:hypothetical protein
MRPLRYSYCMTLRLEPAMESQLEDLAYDMRLSKAGAIRRILARAIADTHRLRCSDLEGKRGRL